MADDIESSAPFGTSSMVRPSGPKPNSNPASIALSASAPLSINSLPVGAGGAAGAASSSASVSLRKSPNAGAAPTLAVRGGVGTTTRYTPLMFDRN